MKETSGLSLTSSIDYFSDEDVDVCKPPVLDRQDDLGTETNKSGEIGPSAELVKTMSKPDIESEQGTSEPSIEPALQEARDSVEGVKEDTQPTGSRESIQEDSESSGAGPKMDDSSHKTEENTVVKAAESSDHQPKTIKPSSSNVTVVPYPTLEMVEVFDKLESEPRDNTASREISNAQESEVATMNLNMNSLKEAKSKDSFCTPKPSVSFAEDVSQDDGLSRNASGLSKKSLYSRVSRISAKKSRSKDSTEASKTPAGEASVAASMKSKKSTSSLKSDAISNSPSDTKSEAGDVSKIDSESKSTVLQSEENASLVTNDQPEQPITKSDSLQRSIHSKPSKDSSRSKVSKSKDKDFVLKTSSSKDDTGRNVISPVTTPKVFGPPRRLSRWGGIPKPPEPSTSNVKYFSDNTPSETAPESDVGIVIDETKEVEAFQPDSAAPTCIGKHEKEDYSNDKLDVKPDEEVVPEIAPLHSRDKTVSNLNELVDEEPCIDATSTLTSSSGKRSSSSKNKDTKSSSSRVAANAENDVNDGKDLSNTENAKEMLVDEDDFLDAKKDSENKKITIDVPSIENDPIQDVMKPFSPISVPVCATEEDPIMKNLSEVCLSDDALETENIRQIPQPEENTNTNPPDVKSDDLIQKKLIAEKAKKNNLSRKNLSSSIFGIIGRSSRAVTSKQEKSPFLKLESLESKIGADDSENATDQGNLQVTRKEVGCVVDSPNRDEVEVVKPATPKSTRTKSLGFFGNGLHKNQHVKGDRLKATTKIKSKTSALMAGKEPELYQGEQSTNHVGAEESQPPSETTIANQEIINQDDDGKLKQNEQVKELDAIEAPGLTATNRAKSKIQNAWNTTGVFQKSRVSNEQKRRVAMKALGKSQKVTRDQKERAVKLSALIDEKVVVESLHVADSGSQTKTRPSSDQKECANTIILSKTLTPSNKNVNQGKKNEDNFAPIILVDCRSSKGIETIGKVHPQTSRSLKGRIGFLLSPFSRSAKVSERKQAAKPVQEREVDSGYTSGDTVTEANEVELTKVAHLDVPFASKDADPMPNEGHIDELPSGNASKNNPDVISSADLQLCNSPSWIAPILEFFSPKVSTSTLEKSNAVEAENKKSHFDEALSEFNECHNFYVQSCTDGVHDSIIDGEVSKNTAAAEIVDATQQSPRVIDTSWTDHFMEWISPKSKNVAESAKNLNEMAPEEKHESIEKVDIDDNDRSNMPEKSAHEGTEIALDCSEQPCATETVSTPEEKALTKGGRFFNSFSLLGKKSNKNDEPKKQNQPKVNKQGPDAPEELMNGRSSPPVRAHRFSKLFLKKPKKEIEPVENARSVVAEPKKNCEEVSEMAPISENVPVVEPNPPDDLPSSPQEEVLVRATDCEKIEAPNALFTFTSDECPTEATNSGQKTSLAETKNTPQKGCCEDSNVMEGVVGFDEDSSRDNIRNLIAGKQAAELDDDVESSVGYLSLVKSKRQARRNRGESGADSSRASGLNEKEKSNCEDVVQTATTSDNNDGKVEIPINSSEMDVHRRVSAVSDELVEEMKTNLSSASSSIPASLYESKDGPGKSSFLSSIEGKESKDTSIREQVVSQTLPRNRVAAKPPRPKRGIPSTKANRRPIPHKDEDSIGVTVNSQLNTFDDDLSGVFAPVTKSGKWLW